MRIDREWLVPTNAPLVGFGGTKVYPLGAVTLPVTVGDYLQQIIKDVTFLLVDYSFALQCHPRTTYPQLVEGHNFDLPHDD